MLFNELVNERLRLFVIWLAGALAACSSTVPTSPIEREVPQQPASSVDEVQISRKVLLLGDTQLHDFYGAPIFLAGEVAQDISGVAIRPAQKRLFGSELLKRVIKWNKKSENLPIIHMGDAIDVSCRTEWGRFIKLMEPPGIRTEWVLVPGNHDGYFEGIIYPEEDENPSKDRPYDDRRYGNKGWDLRCTDRKNNLRKPDFISTYLEAKHLCSKNNATNTPVFCKGRQQEDLVETVVYRIAQKPWQSFLLQVIRLTPNNRGCGNDKSCPPVFGIHLDTSQYETSRKLFSVPPRDAGRHGEIRQDQADAARAEIERLRKRTPARGLFYSGTTIWTLLMPPHVADLRK
ncbi:MAG: metallophosphoesterase [Candidatus Binatia bacterium]